MSTALIVMAASFLLWLLVREPWRRAAFVGVLALCGLYSLGVVWDATWEGRPAGTELASDLDLFIQEFKDEVGDRGSVESIYGVGSNDNGLHRLGSARAFLQNAAPTDMLGVGGYNSTAGAFVGTVLTTNEPNGTVDQGTARLWVDADGLDAGIATDDNQLNVWVDTVGFTPVRAEGAGALRLGSNLITNGSFEVTDGTGSAASITVPQGWVLLLTPTIAYDDPTAVSEGEGIALETIGAGAPFEGVQQTLTSLKADTDYVIRARARPVTALDSCRLQVTGGDSTQTDTSVVAGNLFETLEVVVNTTAVPAALVVTLAAVADTDECDWDHVTAFEQDAVVAQSGIQVCRQAITAVTAGHYTNAAWASSGVTCAITPPGPGYIVRITGQMLADNDSGGVGAGLAGRLQENGVTVDFSVDQPGTVLTNMAVQLGFTRMNPTPGTTLTYTMDGRESLGATAVDRNIDDAAEDFGEATPTWIQVELIPTR